MKNETLSTHLSGKRVLFSRDEVRNRFFCTLKHKLGSWNLIQKELKTYKSRLEKFRNGKITLPYEKFIILVNCMDEVDRRFFLNNITLKDKNWGKSKGGKITYLKHKEIFELGRIIGSKKTKYHFDINTPLDSELCEFVGAFIGDGFFNKYQNIYIIQFSGHARFDEEYFNNILVPYIKKISPESNPIIKRYDNTLRLTIYSKELYELLTNRFKIPPGKKSHSIKIPEEIINIKKPELVMFCIRGIFDTDGSVYFDDKKYIRIGLHMESKELLRQISEILTKNKIKNGVTKDGKKLQINGRKNCKDFMELVGFSNRKHLKKIFKYYGADKTK